MVIELHDTSQGIYVSGHKSLYEIQGSKVCLYPHEGQAKVWRSKRRFIFMIAGTQGGKTSFGPWWLHREILTCGPGDYLAATSSYDLFKLKMLPELRNIFEHTLGVGRYWSGDKIIELADPTTREFYASRADDPMWGRIILRSASAEGGLESATAKAAWLDEVGQDDFSVDAWQAVLRRVSLNHGRILGTTTPYNLGWLKQLIFDRWARGDDSYEVVQFASTMNPLFTEEEMEEARKMLPDWKFRMFYMGQFERPAGMIYDCFIDKDRSEGGHLIEPFEIPKEWPRVVGVDPGAANTAKIWMAYDIRDDVYYLYKEEHGVRQSTPEHASSVMEDARKNGYQLTGIAIGQPSESQFRMDWRMAGAWPVLEPPVKDLEAGLDRAYRMIKQKKVFVFTTAIGFRDQIMTYSRELDSAGNVTEKIKNKEQFHFMDAFRYACNIITERGVGFS